MTIALTILALAIAPPDARGGLAIGPDRGGHATPVVLVRELERFDDWVCIHNHEGAWNDRGDPYWGGLQMDKPFMWAYGRDMIARHKGGLADTWTPAEQIIVAERAYKKRGFGPWPNTRIPCHV